MRVTIFLLLSIVSLKVFAQRIIDVEEVMYDKQGNIIASLDYFKIFKHQEATFRDTVTNIRYKVDTAHKFVTALNQKGDTLWRKDPYVVHRTEYELKYRALEFEDFHVDSFKSMFENSYPGKMVNQQDTTWHTSYNLDRPEYISAMKFGRIDLNWGECKKGETVLYVKADSRFRGFIDLKTGQFYVTGHGW